MGNFTPVSPAFTVLKPLTGLLLFGQLIALTMTIYFQSNTETLQTPGNAEEAGRQIGQMSDDQKESEPLLPAEGAECDKAKGDKKNKPRGKHNPKNINTPDQQDVPGPSSSGISTKLNAILPFGYFQQF